MLQHLFKTLAGAKKFHLESSDRKPFGGSNGFIGFYNETDSAWRTVITNAGNVGIGTTGPGAQLDIAGPSSPVIQLTDNSGGSAPTTLKLISTNTAGGDASASIYTTTNARLELGANNDYDAMVISTSGNVGIGTTGPAGKLDVHPGGSQTAGDLVVDTANKIVYVGRQSATSGDGSVFYVRDRLNRKWFTVDTNTKAIDFNPEAGHTTFNVPSSYLFNVDSGAFVVDGTSGNVGIGTT